MSEPMNGVHALVIAAFMFGMGFGLLVAAVLS